MADEPITIQVESSSDTLGEAPIKSTPGVTEHATAAKPVESNKGSEEVTEEEHGDEAGDDERGEQQPTEPGKANTPRGVQKKLDKLTARTKTAEQERDYWRAEALKAKESSGEQRKAATESKDSPPTREQFEYDEDKYIEAMTDYRLEQKMKAIRADEQKQREQQEIAEKSRAWKERADAFAESHPDFQDVALNPNLPVTEVMADVIRDSDVGHELLYYLGQHPEEAARIAQLKPHAVGVALARIEAGLDKPDSVQFTDEHEQPERKVTKAPPPIKTLNPSAPVKRNLADMSMEDYVSERQRTRRKSNGFL